MNHKQLSVQEAIDALAKAAEIAGLSVKVEVTRPSSKDDSMFDIEALMGRQKGEKVEPSVADNLREAASTYEDRNKVYGDSYKRYGEVMMALFPDGIEVFTTDDFNRLGVFNMIVSKITRISANLSRGGHRDSALDLIAYAAMLTELTCEREG